MQEIKSYILKNNLVEISILNIGAVLHKFLYKGQNIVLTYDDINDYIKNQIYLGAIVGRVAGRISDAKFNLNGEEYNLDNNESNYSIHGGYTNLTTRFWHVEKYVRNDINPHIILSTILKDGDSGYPGNVKIAIKYILIESTLRIEIFANSDKDTIVNITNHSYFNLNSDKKKSIKNHKLKINSNQILANEDNGVPYKLMEVDNTDFDFNNFKSLSILNKLTHPQSKKFNGLDHAFILNGKVPSLVLKNEKFELLINTSYPSLVVYTGNEIGNKFDIANTKSYNHQGIAIEAQYEPDFINKDFLPNYILKKDNELIQFIEYKIDIV